MQGRIPSNIHIRLGHQERHAQDDQGEQNDEHPRTDLCEINNCLRALDMLCQDLPVATLKHRTEEIDDFKEQSLVTSMMTGRLQSIQKVRMMQSVVADT